MSLSLLQGATYTNVRRQVPFAGAGGVEPYAYSVAPGGAGGTINPTTGLYTAPAVSGKDTIVVSDAAPASATTTIRIGTPLELVCDVIQSEMGLADGQVYLWDQKILIPKDSRLYVVVGTLSCKPFANNIYFDGQGSGLQAIQSVNMQATLSIDIFSRGPEARDRKEELILALNSLYAQQQQAANSFRIFPITTNFVNLSDEDGAAIPYRFNISVNIQYFVSKTKSEPYYDHGFTPSVSTDPEEG